MKKIQKIMQIVLLLSILVYAVKRHTDTASDFASSVWKMLSEPLQTLNKIQKSEKLLGFPGGSLEISDAFKEKLPEEKMFFLSDALYSNPLFSQRMIEYHFPRVYDKSARCGIVPQDDPEFFKLQIVDRKGGYTIVCRL